MDPTVATDAFLNLMVILRKTILQDAVYMIQIYRDHLIWRKEPFGIQAREYNLLQFN
ncbi:unnamed protein product [Absidia cylindrospora]